MKEVILISMVLACGPSLAAAADIFGTITEVDKPAANAQVTIVIDGKPYGSVTDRDGSYRVFVPETGKAMLTVVTVGGKPHSIDVFSSERATRYDFVIAPDGRMQRL